MAGKKPSAEQELSFSAAMEELEQILQRIEDEEIDIDELAGELRRTAELLDLCRGKLKKADLEVTQIVQTLEAEREEAGEGEDEEEEPEDPGDEEIPF